MVYYLCACGLLQYKIYPKCTSVINNYQQYISGIIARDDNLVKSDAKKYQQLVKWNALGYTFALRIPFHLLQWWCNTCTNLDQQMIWSTSYYHVTLLVHRSWPHLLFTVALVHWRQVFAQASQPCDLSLQSLWLALHACNQSIKPSLILIFPTLVTWLHVMSHMQWAPSSHVRALQHLQAISPP